MFSEAFVCIQIIIGLLVFALGLPTTIILSVAVDERIRYLALRHGIWSGLVPLMLTMVAGVGVVTVNELVIADLGHDWALTFRDAYLFMPLIFSIAVVYYYSTFFRIDWDLRAMIARSLEGRLVRGEEQGWSFHTLPRRDVEDLVALGEHSAPGQQKELVLGPLKNLIETMALGIDDKDAEAKYRDAGLDDLIRSLTRVVNNQIQAGNKENFEACAEILDLAWRSLDNRPRPDGGRYSNGSYGVTIVQVLEELSFAAMQRFPQSTTQRFLDAFPPEPGLHFRLGREALHHERFEIAVASLSRLEAIADQNGEDLIKDLIGLLAHFWCLEGAGRKRAEMTLTVMELEGAALLEALETARQYHYESAHFDTVAWLDRMLEEIEPPPRPGWRTTAQ